MSDAEVLAAISAEAYRASMQRRTAAEMAEWITDNYSATPERAAAIVERMQRAGTMLCGYNAVDYCWLLDPS